MAKRNWINELADLRDREGIPLKDTDLLTHYIQQGEARFRKLVDSKGRDGLTAWSWEEDYFADPSFDGARVAENRIFELYQGKTVPPADIVKCPKCALTDVAVVKTQDRRADEGGSARAKCNNCGHVWRPS